MSPAARRGLVVFLVGLVLILGVFAADVWWFGGGDNGGIAGVSIGGPFTLTDQNGAVRRDSDFRGVLMLVYFGYTYCPDVCPAELATMSAAMDKLGEHANEVRPIFITIDPARDTVEQLKLYATNFTPMLEALTGTPEQIAAAARGYRVYYAKAKGARDDDYTMDHSGFVYLMARDGHYLQHFGPSATAEEMAAAIQKHL
jgi:cytochrome oxidase Cu insertion factor (SCO1/SenC/PrrC family)